MLRPEIVRLKLLQDNACPHTSKMTLTHLRQLKFEVLTHPAYRPDLPPSDFHLFRSFEHYLVDMMYHSYDVIANDLQAFFDSIDEKFSSAALNSFQNVRKDAWKRVATTLIVDLSMLL